MKRGISPLLSFVLLLGFVIVVGTIVMNWAIDQVKTIPVEEAVESDIYCGDVSFRVNSTEKKLSGDNQNPGSIRINYINTGRYSITRFTIQRETTNDPLGSCLLLNPGIKRELEPGSSKVFELGLGGRIGSSGNIECRLLPKDATCENDKVVSLAMVPWIKIDDSNIACSDRKTVFDPNNLNPGCI